MILIIIIIKLFLDNAILGFHLGFSAKLKIQEVPACKMRPQSGYEGRKKICTTVHQANLFIGFLRLCR